MLDTLAEPERHKPFAPPARADGFTPVASLADLAAGQRQARVRRQ